MIGDAIIANKAWIGLSVFAVLFGLLLFGRVRQG